MPKKLDRCVKKIKKKIKKGEIPKTYKYRGKRKKTSPYAICRASLKKKKKRKSKLNKRSKTK